MRALIMTLLILPGVLFAGLYEEATLAYKKGEKTESIEEREAYFNQALSLYTQEESTGGRHLYNIGNCYYQLGQLGLAIWYYEKALKELPREIQIQENLAKAKQQAHVIFNPWESVQKHLFFWNQLLSKKEQGYAFAGLMLLTFFLISGYIWLKKTPLKLLSIGFCLLCAFLVYKETDLISRPQKGLFVQPALLRCAPGNEYQTVDSELVPAGQWFTMVGVSEDKEWVKVKTYPQKTGYVHHSLVRLF